VFTLTRPAKGMTRLLVNWFVGRCRWARSRHSYAAWPNSARSCFLRRTELELGHVTY
jgi:hypothetical protein